MTRLRRTLAALLIGAAALTVSAGSASAAVAATAAPAVVAPAVGPLAAAPDAAWCRNSQVPHQERREAGCFGERSASNVYLPSERWANSAGALHSRKIGGITNLGTDLAVTLQRDASFPMYISIGNTMWSWTTSMVSVSVRMDFLSDLGAMVDGIVAALGRALIGSPLVVGILIGGLTLVAWRAMRGRGGGAMGYLGRVTVILSVLVAMVAGASASTVSDSGQYTPGTLSPGWTAKTVNGVLSSLASAPAAALTASLDAVPGADESEVTGALSCQAYVAKLAEQYVASGGGSSQVASRMESAVPLLLSRMWEQTGLQAWKVAQFGNANNYGEWAYCRLLEERAGISSAEQGAYTVGSAGMPAGVSFNANAAPWGTGRDNDAEDRNLVAWASCRMNDSGQWTVDPGWAGVSSKAITADECSRWWNDDYYTGEGEGTGGIISASSNFDWSGKPSEAINLARDQREVKDYLLSLHGAGSNAGGNLVLVVSYLLSSFVMMIVFGLLSLVTLLFKLYMVVLTFSVVFTLIRDLLPSDGQSATAKLLRSYLGTTFVVFGIGLVLALVTTLTSAVISGAATAFGGGSVMTMMTTGMAPAVALGALHMVFTKVLKMPSPLTVSGANAWGRAAAGGAVGGAVGAGAMEMVGRRGAGMARSAGKSAVRNLSSRVRPGQSSGPGRGGRPGRAGRSSGVAGPTLAAGVGATAGAAAASGAGTTRRPGRGSRGVDRSADARVAAALADSTAPERTQAPRPERRPGTSRLDHQLERGQAWAAAKEAELRMAAKARRQTTIERRGYGGGVAGAALEGVTQRVSEARAEFAKSPVRASLGAVGKSAKTIAGVGAATVLTGGFALPVVLAYGAAKQVKATEQARRRAVATHAERVARNAADTRQAQAAKRQSQLAAAPQPAPTAPDTPSQGPVPPAGAAAQRRARPVAVARASSRRPARATAPAARQVAGAKRPTGSPQW